MQDICPQCHRQFIVPGERAMANFAAKEFSAKEAASLAKEVRRQTKESKAHESLEFLVLLESVAEDGELSNSEIRGIARWINEHAEGRQHWPASMFLPLLKQVFADGQIDNSESRLVAGLIQSVSRDWVRQYGSIHKDVGEEVPSRASETVAEFASSCASETLVEFAPSCAKLPAIPISISVPSENTDGVEYKLDFQYPSCTCPDFKSCRKKLPQGHMSRCCKHLMRGYGQIRPESGWPYGLSHFLRPGSGLCPIRNGQPYPLAMIGFLFRHRVAKGGQTPTPIWKVNRKNMATMLTRTDGLMAQGFKGVFLG